MTWLKMDHTTPEKPEVLAITLRMGWDDPDITVGKLFRLWRWFDQQTVDGNAPTVSSALLDRVIGVSGFCDVVASVGWLTVSDAGVSLPGFAKHNGQSAKDRANTAKRVAKHSSKRSTNDLDNGASVSAPLPREEKRREEVNTPQPPKGGGDPPGFSEFWNSWPNSPRKVARKQCAEKWRRKGFSSQQPAILAHVEAMKLTKQWQDGFEPAPLTYLNGERWGDGLPADADSQAEAGFI